MEGRKRCKGGLPAKPGGVVSKRRHASERIPCIERFGPNGPLILDRLGFTYLGFTCLGTADLGRPFENGYRRSSKVTFLGGMGNDVPGAGDGERRSVTCTEFIPMSHQSIDFIVQLCIFRRW